MRLSSNFKFRLLFTLLVIALFAAGCTIKIPISRPEVSQFMYEDMIQEPVDIIVKDARSEGEKGLTRGVLRGGSILIMNLDDPIAFIEDELVKEMRARGINARRGSGEAEAGSALVLEVDRFYFRHHRSTGYSPYITFTNFRARTSFDGVEHVVTSYFHAGKVPIMSMGEIVEPTYNYPLSIVIKEVATKLNRYYFHLTVPEDVVRSRIRSSEERADCMSIMDLAFTGSTSALPTLKDLAKEGRGNTVKCALSAIGIIGDTAYFDFLKDIYAAADGHALLLSLKAIGDLNTAEALEFVRDQPGHLHPNIQEVIDLYSY